MTDASDSAGSTNAPPLPIPRAVAVVGPTAAGKSRLAMRLAEALSLEICCCDSVQVYRGLDIGSAKPTRSERARVGHRLLDLVEPDEDFTAGDYAAACLERLRRGPSIICGGTGFYLRSASRSLPVPDGAEDVTAKKLFAARWEAREEVAPGATHHALAALDPEAAATIHPHNARRALRALWLSHCAGGGISEFRAQRPPRKLLELLMIIVDPGVAAVDAAIDARCESMLAAGWLDEVESLRMAGYDARHRAMRSLGYRQLALHLDGQQGLPEAVATIKSETRQYARRQRTYFRHQFPELSATGQLLRAAPDLSFTDLLATTRSFLETR